MTMERAWCEAARVMVPFGLAFGESLGRHFDAVVAGVAHEVGQRVGDLLDQPLVQLGGFALGHQF